MDLQTISILKSLTHIFMIVLPSYILVPKGLAYWKAWKKTEGTMHLSNALMLLALGALSYAGALVILIMRLLGLA